MYLITIIMEFTTQFLEDVIADIIELCKPEVLPDTCVYLSFSLNSCYERVLTDEERYLRCIAFILVFQSVNELLINTNREEYMLDVENCYQTDLIQSDFGNRRKQVLCFLFLNKPSRDSYTSFRQDIVLQNLELKIKQLAPEYYI
jgi:hypothetical protein